MQLRAFMTYCWLGCAIAYVAALAPGLCTRAAAQDEKTIRVSGFVAAGNGCAATFTRNPATQPTITNTNIKIGGALPTVPDPNTWDVMDPNGLSGGGLTGIYVELYENGVPVTGYHESNTVLDSPTAQMCIRRSRCSVEWHHRSRPLDTPTRSLPHRTSRG